MGQPRIRRRAHTDGSYLSASDPRVHFGLEGAANVQALVVEWPSGQIRHAIKADRMVTLRQ